MSSGRQLGQDLATSPQGDCDPFRTPARTSSRLSPDGRVQPGDDPEVSEATGRPGGPPADVAQSASMPRSEAKLPITTPSASSPPPPARVALAATTLGDAARRGEIEM